MRHSSAYEIQPPIAEFHSRTNMRAMLVGAVTVSLVFGGCTPEPTPDKDMQKIERPAPESNNYLYNPTDPYYEEVASVLPRAHDPVAKENIRRLLKTPIAQWLNGSKRETVKLLKENIRLSEKDGSIPMLIAYNIPFRDLDGDSGGGANDGAAYKDWIAAISNTIADSQSIVILEPDALADAPKIDDERVRNERYNLLRGALRKLKENNPNTAVYLDAGHSKWHSVDALVGLIKKVDAKGDLVYGLSLNVSNQRPEDELRKYAAHIWQKLGRKVYVMLDNSMNGAPNTAELLDWCNPKGEKIGKLDDYIFNREESIEEAYIKNPGESDGDCGTSTKAPGEFDNDLLLKQVSK